MILIVAFVALFGTSAYFIFGHYRQEEQQAELSLYDTGVSAEYGDKLITLSTCEYSLTNGRLVLVAKRISD